MGRGVDVRRIHRGLGKSLHAITGDPTLEAIRRLRLLCLFLTVVPGIAMTLMMAVAPAGARSTMRRS